MAVTRIKDDVNAEIQFATEVSKRTGLNFYTAFGWAEAENGPITNPLGLGGGQNGSNAPTIPAAAQAVADNLRNHPEWYKSLTEIANRQYSSRDMEIAAEAHAIAMSPWGQDPITKKTGAGAKPNYENNIKFGALRAINKEIVPGTVATPATPGASAGLTPPAESLGGLAGALDAIGGFFSAILSQEFWIRVGMGIVGVGIVFIGLKRLAD